MLPERLEGYPPAKDAKDEQLRNFAQIKAEVQRLSNRTDSAFEGRIEDAVNRAYRQVIQFRNWPQLVRTSEFTFPADRTNWGLPQQVDRILRIAISDSETTLPFVVRGAYPVHTQPSSASAITLSISPDLSTSVRFSGYRDGVVRSESGTYGPSGINSVVTTETFDFLTVASRTDTTVTEVTLYEDSTELGIIPSGQSQVRYLWIEIARAFDEDTPIEVTHVIYASDLVSDTDVPILPECEDVVIVGASADVHRMLRDYQFASQEEARFRAMLEEYSVGNGGTTDYENSFQPQWGYR